MYVLNVFMPKSYFRLKWLEIVSNCKNAVFSQCLVRRIKYYFFRAQNERNLLTGKLFIR